MKRSLMQIYVTGSADAVVFYQKAFVAPLVASYKNKEGTFMHAELDINGQILALSERNSEYAIIGETVTGNTMQFCFEYGEGNEELLKNTYEVLKKDAKILMPLAPCDYSALMTDLIDQYGIRWCLFL